MGKNKKGKQKQDESAINNQTQQSTVKQVNVPDNIPPNVNSFSETQNDTWGATAPATWEPLSEAKPQGDTWPAQDTETWDTAEALLQPPLTETHNNLPTIHEHPSSGNFGQNRLSEIEESPDEYDQSWHNSDSNSVHHSESQTVTAAAPSLTGSPTAPAHSTSVLQEAMKAVLTQGSSTASEAARKMEKVKAVQFREPAGGAKVERTNPQVGPHQPSSSASAAAAAAESSRKRTQAPSPGQKASNSKTIPWTYPKEFKPGARAPAQIPTDPSWISTGGNAWSNKHRNGFQNQSWSPGNEYSRTQYSLQPQFHQHAQHTQQARQSHHAQRPQARQRHHLHPTQPQTHHSQSIRPLLKVQTKERQDWQDWGKEQWDHSSETESDDETATGWETSNQHEGDQWGRSRGEVWGQNQNATGGGWGHGVAQNGWGAGEGRKQNTVGGWEQNAGEGRGQHTGGGWDHGAAAGGGQSAAGGWGQGAGDTWGQSAGGWAQESTKPKKDGRARKSHPTKGGNERNQGGDTWAQGHEISGQKGQKQGNPWAEANDARGQFGQESTQRQTQDAWGQHTNHEGGQGGDAWGQGASTWGQDTNHRGGQGGDAWGQGASTWGQDTTHQGGQGGDVWGQGVSTWGQDTSHTGGQGGNAWGQGVSTWTQDINHRGGQGGDVGGQGASAWGQDTNHRGGQGGDVGGQGAPAWGQDTNHRVGQGGDVGGQGAPAWGQDTIHRVGQGGDVGGQGAPAWGQDTNHRGGQGGDAWGQGASTWGQDTGDNRKLAGEWAAGASGNAAWGDEAQRLPKVTAAAPPEPVGSRNVLSAQQRSQILSNLLNQNQTQNVKVAQKAVKHEAQKKAEHEQWGAWEARDHGWGSEDDDDMDDTRRVHFSPKVSELWGESPRSIPSKTLARAQHGMTTTLVNDPNNVRFLESKGAAFEYVTNAFFGNSRLARERIHWLFPSDKDPRVAAMLAWVQKLSYNLGTFGLIKFLQHRERGGLFINAIFRMRHNPKEPALDWLTFNELQGTMDKTLQESVAFYDPSAQVMVFVYLPSESGNSIAIWRLKINVPDKTKLKYHAEINGMVKSLRKPTEYVVCLDERPPKKKPAQRPSLLRKVSVKATKDGLPKEKRKWWQFF